MNDRLKFVAASVAIVLVWTGMALATPTNNLELVAVPTPGKVVIDGKSDDWDFSGSILSCPNTKTFPRVAAVRSAAMYDAAGLYICCRWVDPTPMANMVNPAEPGKHNQGWRSDCLQIRMLSDTQVHITAWYCKANKKMAVDVSHGRPATPKPNEALSQGAKMAFTKNSDGRGYVQELFLPWKLLSKAGKTYKAGDSFGFGLHFNWGKGDNKSWRGLEWQDVVSGPVANRTFFWQDQTAWGKIRFSPRGRITLPPQPWDQITAGPDLSTVGPVQLKYDLPADSRVTLVVEDDKGRRVRNLISAYPRHKGANTDFWDGFDDRGLPAPAGKYRWRGLFHPGVHARYKLHLFPTANPPWNNAAGTGGWGADHSAPAYATAHGDRAYLLYHTAEGGSALLACDLKGNKLWGHGGALQGGGNVCVTDGKDLYYANSERLIRVDPATGEARPFATGQANLPHGFQRHEPPTGIAFHGGRLFLASAKKNLIRVFDLKTDKPLNDLAVPSPMGLAVDARGQLFAVSGNAVVRVEMATGKMVSVVAKGLSKPHGLAVGTNGNIFVVNGGTHQVFIYSTDGKRRIREIGTRGGRAAVGKWNQNGIRNPTGIGLDRLGNVWIAEADAAAKRFSKWGDDGKNLGEWLGPSPYSGDGVVDHHDRSRIYCGGLEFKVNWKTGKSQPLWTHLRGPSQGQPASADMIAHGSFWHRQGFTMTYKGHDYFCFDRGLICIKRGPAWVPAASIGSVKRNGDQLLWSDRNEDGKVQDNETVALKDIPGGGFGLGGGGGWGVVWSRRDLSTVRMTNQSGRVIRFTPVKFSAGGVPIFDQRSVSTVQLAVWGGNGGPVDVDDDIMIDYYEDSHAPWIQKLREHPLGDMRGIKAYNRRAELRWTYPQPFSGVHGAFKAPLPTRPGQVIGTVYVMGTADLGKQIGKLVCFNGYYGQRFLITSDGLFVQALFKDGRMMPATPEKATPGMLVDEMSPGNESFAGTFSRNDNGEVYLTSSFGGPMCVVMSVEGLESIRRLAGGACQLTPALIARGRTARKARQAATQAGRRSQSALRIVRGTRKIDGSLDDWNLKTGGVQIVATAGRKATAALARDKKFLYVAFRVPDKSPWRNGGKESKVIFLHGDSVDIQLGLDPKADPQRGLPVAGDLRIVIAPKQKKTIVMLYRPVVPKHAGPRVPFISPVGRVELDCVEQLRTAQVVVNNGENGYVLEAAIPLALLGGHLASNAKLRGDVGVLYSNDLGTECILRSHWSNRETNVTSDLPSEIRFEPKHWGTVHVE